MTCALRLAIALGSEFGVNARTLRIIIFQDGRNTTLLHYSAENPILYHLLGGFLFF